MEGYKDATKIETAQQALELLERAVETRGRDYVYQKRIGPIESAIGETGERCYYIWENEPDCLIGVALSLAGWTSEMLAKLDARAGGTSIFAIAEDDRSFAELVSSDALSVFNVAQSVQDTGGTWGEASDAAALHAANFR